MNPQPHAGTHRPAATGFTLLELLIVIVIIAILAGLTMGIFRIAQESSAKGRTVQAHASIMAALELYKEKWGEYPEPSNPEETYPIGGRTFRSGGAHMLYQVMTSDGTSAIKLPASASGSASESDGEIDDAERDNSINAAPLPRTVVYPPPSSGGTQARLIVDGWSHPFQYTKADPSGLKQNAVNNTGYDLWSYGNKGDTYTGSDDIATKRTPEITGPWIKNW